MPACGMGGDDGAEDDSDDEDLPILRKMTLTWLLSKRSTKPTVQQNKDIILHLYELYYLI